MKKQFDIKYRPQIESGEYKVETRDGKKVRVLCYDANNIVPVVALVTFNDGSEGSRDYYSNGTMNCDKENPLDLFVVTPEEELTEFEKVVKDRLWRTLEYSETFRKDENKWTRELAAELLALAPEELKKKFVFLDYFAAFDAGKAEALKDMPRWKKIKEEDNACVREPHVGTNMVGEKMLYIGNHAISISRLEKLPGFKEDESGLIEVKEGMHKTE